LHSCGFTGFHLSLMQQLHAFLLAHVSPPV
jgi:hypothetical protein